VRSGIEIEAEYAGKDYARPAGHLGKRAQSRRHVGRLRGHRTARQVYGKAWSCGYKLNVAGGWYDAGDFGKYVVNGGIAAAQLLASYERALHYSGKTSPALADRLVSIPEAGNGVPDILDEARWELDFLVSMMVPEGEPYAGHGASQDARQPLDDWPDPAASRPGGAGAASAIDSGDSQPCSGRGPGCAAVCTS
jgi:endoglucanase